jgi:hypothetical protein
MSVEEIRKAVLEQEESEPRWGDGEVCGRMWLAEAVVHPEEPPLLRIYQLDETEGAILGEIWLRPADLPELINDLRIILEDYARRPTDRRWFDRPDGPTLNLMGAEYYVGAKGELNE